MDFTPLLTPSWLISDAETDKPNGGVNLIRPGVRFGPARAGQLMEAKVANEQNC